MSLAEPLTDDEIADARRRIADVALRTPLVRDGGQADLAEARMPAADRLLQDPRRDQRAAARGACRARSSPPAPAISARRSPRRRARHGLKIVIHVPDNAARVKIDSLKRLGAEVHEHSHEEWWRIMATRDTGDDGRHLHPPGLRARGDRRRRDDRRRDRRGSAGGRGGADPDRRRRARLRHRPGGAAAAPGLPDRRRRDRHRDAAQGRARGGRAGDGAARRRASSTAWAAPACSTRCGRCSSG